MNSFGKKILSAFVDIRDAEKATASPVNLPASTVQSPPPPGEVNSKFTEHFNTLFAEANLPGPDYYEFSKMIDVMQAITDEKARYSAAFAGLQVQGLDKQKLLNSTQQYLQILADDATTFHHTVSTAFEEKVGNKREAIATAKTEMQQLSQQIVQLQEQITKWTEEIAENEAKIQSNNSGYHYTMECCKSRLLADIEKINQYIL